MGAEEWVSYFKSWYHREMRNENDMCPLKWRHGYLLNLRAGYRFWHEQAELAVSVYNMLNDRHVESPGGDVIGSRVMGWFTLRL